MTPQRYNEILFETGQARWAQPEQSPTEVKIRAHYERELGALRREEISLDRRRLLCGIGYGVQWAACLIAFISLAALGERFDDWRLAWLAVPLLLGALVLGARHSHHAERGLGAYRSLECWRESVVSRRAQLSEECEREVAEIDKPRAKDHFAA